MFGGFVGENQISGMMLARSLGTAPSMLPQVTDDVQNVLVLKQIPEEWQIGRPDRKVPCMSRVAKIRLLIWEEPGVGGSRVWESATLGHVLLLLYASERLESTRLMRRLLWLWTKGHSARERASGRPRHDETAIDRGVNESETE
jgi:hypothetical protein